MNLSGKTNGQYVTYGLQHLVSSHFTTCKAYLVWRTWRENHLVSGVGVINFWSNATAVQSTGYQSITTVLDQTSERISATFRSFSFSNPHLWFYRQHADDSRSYHEEVSVQQCRAIRVPFFFLQGQKQTTQQHWHHELQHPGQIRREVRLLLLMVSGIVELHQMPHH